MRKTKGLAILGSTGSVGRSTLDILSKAKEGFNVTGLSTNKNITLLKEQVKQFSPKFVAIRDSLSADEFRSLNSFPGKVFSGLEGMEELASARGTDVVVMAISGAEALKPFLSAIRSSKTVILANKEALVMAGSLIMEEVRRYKTRILPVDSEQSALFQLLDDAYTEDVHKVYITCSGGPFLNWSKDKIYSASPGDTLKHPTWQMGKKITVDSATLANKAFEVIEAHWLFNVPLDKIKVVIHPQSLIHGMVEYSDGRLFASMHKPDMRIPISYALGLKSFSREDLTTDFTSLGPLTFQDIDEDRFPLFRIIIGSLKLKNGPLIATVANDIAVDAFLKGVIKFGQIPEVVFAALSSIEEEPREGWEHIFYLQDKTKQVSQEIIEGLIK